MPLDEPHAGGEARSRIGKYELLGRLAVGGMAEVFLVRSAGFAGFEKRLVLKRILPQYAADGSFIRRFMEEARLLSALSHPNISQVHDAGLDGGEYFFTLEYVHGVDLWRMMNRARERGRAVPLEVSIGIAAGVAAGLHHAHEARSASGEPMEIIHRDVSPSNVMVGFDGAVKLIDFGIARRRHQRELTRPGLLRGKVGYVSPEQARGEPIDRRSDLFSLGVLLYELTTGSAAFDGDSELQVLDRIARADVEPPSVKRQGFSTELEQIILRALSLAPQDRFATARELQLELEALAREQKLAVSPIALTSFLEELFPDARAAIRPGFESDPAAEHVDAPATEALTNGAPVPRVPVAAATVERRVNPRLVGASLIAVLLLMAGGLLVKRFVAERDVPVPHVAPPAPVSLPAAQKPASPPPDEVKKVENEGVAETQSRRTSRRKRVKDAPTKNPERGWDRDSMLPP